MKRLIFCALLPITLLSGCSSVSDHIPGWLKPYTPDVHQGNVVTSEMVDALHEGMTKNQVIFLLGTPALRNLFHKEQWNYVYYLKPRFGQTSIRKLEITFDEDGRVESFKSDKMPDETNADLAILGERARESTLKRQEELEKEKQEELLTAFQEMREEEKQLLYGKYLMDLSDAELAQMLGCKPSSVRMKLTRARRAFVEKLREGGKNHE